MPERDGFQVVRAIRDRERTTGGHLPVIALTARSRKEDRERCFAAGMDDFLVKPVAAEDLFKAIERVLQSDENENTKDESETPAASGSHALLNPVVLLAACDNDDNSLRARCQDFKTFAPERLAEVEDALQTRDSVRLSRAAHKLCGLLSVFSTVAADKASNLEGHANSGRLDECPPLVQQLKSMTAELINRADSLSIEALRRQARAESHNDPWM